MAIAEVVAKFTADTSGLDASLKRIEASISQCAGSLSNFGGKFQKIGNTVSNIGEKMTTHISAPLAGLGAAAILAGANFEESMSKVAAVTGATGKDFEKLKEVAKQLGETTKFSASEAAQGMLYLGMAGFKTNEIIDAMPAVLNLATAGALDLGRAADITSNIMSAFGMKSEEAGHMADVLAKAASSANTSVEQMGYAMGYAGPIANSFGISVEEAAAAISLMSNAGIQGERAGTALRGILSQLSNVTGSTEKTLRKYGLTAEDVNPKTKSLAEIIEVLANAGVKASDAMELVGVEAGPAMAVLLQEGTSGLQDFTSMLENADGSAQKMAQTMANNTKGAFREFMSALEGLGIAISEHILPALIPFLERLAEMVRKFGELDPATQKIAIGLGAVTIALGPLTSLFGNLLKTIGVILSNLTRLPQVLNMLGSGFSKVVGFASTFWGWLVRLTPVILNIGNVVRTAFTLIAGVMTGTSGIIIAVIAGIVAAGIWLWQNWDSVTKWISNAWNWLTGVASTVWNGIKNIVVGAFKWMYNHNYYFEDLVNFIVNAWNRAKSQTTAIWNSIKSFITPLWNSLKTTATSVWNSIKSVVTSVTNAVKSTVTSAWNNIKSVTSSVWNSVKSIISSTVSSISSTLSGLASKAYSWGSNFMNMFASGIKSKINSVVSTVKNVARTIASYLGFHSPTEKGPASDSDKWAPNFMNMFASGIQNSIPKLAQTVSFAASELASLSQFTANPTIAPSVSGVSFGVGSSSMGGVGGVVITGNTFNVRKDSDIKQIANELYKLQQRQLRSKGRLR
ncbi:phage tail tape measure protein [Thermoactinomyces sp. CICC 23799]|uniref:phage tail tape measure protein n=1 Tax=Thermoactinomyces TaxID=2023 RepID=UPI0018DE1D76|nr:phage tail tape measure protein [Thermoactinomyces sp. CICC 23799]MBH8600138.1 phage tail tape measure protein [Thermoactinomyces sp. CICC 23799]